MKKILAIVITLFVVIGCHIEMSSSSPKAWRRSSSYQASSYYPPPSQYPSQNPSPSYPQPVATYTTEEEQVLIRVQPAQGVKALSGTEAFSFALSPDNVSFLNEPPNSLLGRKLTSLRDKFSKRGLEPIYPIIKVVLNKKIVQPLLFEKNACYLGILVTNSSEVEMSLLDSQLVPLKTALRFEDGGLFTICTTSDDLLSYFVNIESTSSSKEALFALFKGKDNTIANLVNELISGKKLYMVKSELNNLFFNLATKIEGLENQGYRVRVGPVNYKLEEGEQLPMQFVVRKDLCYRVMATTTHSANINQIIKDYTGAIVAYETDELNDSEAEFCSSLDGAYQFSFVMNKGGGNFVFAVLEVEKKSRIDEKLDPYKLISIIDEEQIKKQFQPIGKYVELNLTTKGVVNQELPSLETQSCYSVVILSSSPLTEEVILKDDKGNIVDIDETKGNKKLLYLCKLNKGSKYIVTIKNEIPLSSKVIVRLYKFQGGIKGVFNLKGLSYVRLMEKVIVLGKSGYEPYAPPIKGISLSQGSTVEKEVELKGGYCFSITAVGDENIYDLDLVLKNKDGKIITSDSPYERFPVIYSCIGEHGNYRLEIKANRGNGKVLYQLFIKTRG